MTRFNLFRRLAIMAGICVLPIGHAGTTMDAFSETAAVSSEHGHVRVTITFDNRGDRTVYVPNDLAEEDELTNAFFEIVADDGTKLPYVGIMAKRAPPTADDFHAIAPHARHVNTIDITRSYGFRPGRHRYALSYEARYLLDPQQAGSALSAGTVRAEFVYEK